MIFKVEKIQDLQNKLNLFKDSYHGQLISNYLKRQELPKVFGNDTIFNVLAATSGAKIPKNYYELRTEYIRGLKENIPILNLIGALPENVRRNLYAKISPTLKAISPQLEKVIRKEVFMLETTVEKIWRHTKTVFKGLINFTKSIFENITELFGEVKNALFNYSPMRLLEIIDPLFFAPFLRPIFNKIKEMIKGVVVKVIFTPIKNYTARLFRRIFTKEERPITKDPEVLKLLKGITLAENISKFFGLEGSKLGAGFAIGAVGISLAKNSPFVKMIESVVKNILDKLGIKKESIKKLKQESKRKRHQLEVKFKTLTTITNKKIMSTSRFSKNVVKRKTIPFTNRRFLKMALIGSIISGIYKFFGDFKDLKDKVLNLVPEWASDFLDNPLKTLKTVFAKIKTLFDKYIISPVKLAFSKLKEFLNKLGFDFTEKQKTSSDLGEQKILTNEVSPKVTSIQGSVSLYKSSTGNPVEKKLKVNPEFEHVEKTRVSTKVIEKSVERQHISTKEPDKLKKVSTKLKDTSSNVKAESKKVKEMVRNTLVSNEYGKKPTVETESGHNKTVSNKATYSTQTPAPNKERKVIRTHDTNDLYQIITRAFVDSNILIPDWLTLLH